MSEIKSTSFETALSQIEKIVLELEKGELPLEKQLKHFESGVALARECMQALEEVERKVEILVQSTTGSTTSSAFEASNKMNSN